jgi:uncharacterized protein (DUF302 family)
MKNYILVSIIFLVTGFLAASLLFIYKAPSVMMLEDQSSHGFIETVTNLEKTAKDHGWSVPTIHDLQKSMKKAGKDVREVRVFALCNPDHAVNILKGDEERVVSSMMPCRVAVYVKSDGKTYISRMNSKLMSKGMSSNVRSTMKSAFLEMEEILSGLIITD